MCLAISVACHRNSERMGVRMRERSATCTDPNLQSKIMLDVGFQLGLGKPLALSDDARRHLDECDACRECLPVWIDKAKGLEGITEETELIQMAAAGDPSVLRKPVSEGTALFREDKENPENGLLVIVGDKSPFDVRRVRRMSRREFEQGFQGRAT